MYVNASCVGFEIGEGAQYLALSTISEKQVCNSRAVGLGVHECPSSLCLKPKRISW